MLYLTEILGLPVYDSSGTKVGKVSEVAAQLGSHPPRVKMLILATARKGKLRAVPFEHVAGLSPDHLTLNIPKEQIEKFEPDDSLLLLRKDLLDQQIIDVHGRKVVRVNDLTLQPRQVNHHTELLLSEVDAGVRGALRRLLKGAVPRSVIRKIEAHIKTVAIPWEVVNLIESDPRRQVKLNISHELLTTLHPADLADIVEELTHNERQAILTALDDVTAAEALSEVDPKLQVAIVEAMDPARAADIVEEMPPDAAADLLGDLSEETSSDLLEDMNQEDAAEIGELLEHPENSAGGLMTTEYIAVPSTADVRAARHLMSGIPDLPEHFSTLMLVDDQGKFAGSVPLSRLIVAADAEKLFALRSQPVLCIGVNASEEDVVDLFDKYNLLILPVVDSEERLVGVVTVDDVITLLRNKI
jgi:magnesium transporter